MVNLLLNVIDFQRNRNWNGYLEVLKNILLYYFSSNCDNRARNLSYYYIQVKHLKLSHPLTQKFSEE